MPLEYPGITFGDKHSFIDWGVYWNGATYDPPSPQKTLISVPYKHGKLNVTKALTDKIFYDSRKISFDFEVYDHTLTWPEIRAMILGDIHGIECKIIVDTDPDFYWTAYNCEVSSPEAEEDVLKFSIECECFPYKLRTTESRRTVLVNGQGITTVFDNGRMEVNPVFVTDQEVQMIFTANDGSTYTIAMSAGTHMYDEIEFVKGENALTFNKLTNDATVQISFRQGEL